MIMQPRANNMDQLSGNHISEIIVMILPIMIIESQNNISFLLKTNVALGNISSYNKVESFFYFLPVSFNILQSDST